MPLLAAILILFAAVAQANCTEKCQSLEHRGTTLPDLIWEFEQHAPLNLDPRSAFEFVVAQGSVTTVEMRETELEDWSPAFSCYPAWSQTTIEVERAIAVNSSADTTAGAWTVVERNRFYRDEAGTAFEWYAASGTSRYNHLRIGDRVIVAAVRTRECKDACFYYSPEFCPYFSVVFNVMIRGDTVCVDKPWKSVSAGYWSGGRIVNPVLRSEAVPREEHCYSISADEAFDAIVEAVRAGTPQPTGDQ